MKNLFLLACFFFIVSCSKEDDPEYTTPISGHYKVTSIQSDISADLNNDGIKSNNIFEEIASPHYGKDGKQVSYFNFDSHGSYLEVRPLESSRNNAKIISFKFPSQHIEYFTNGTPYLVMYVRAFIHYRYELNQESNFFQLINTNPDYDENGNLKSLELLENKDLKLLLTKQVFDFVEMDWVELNMTVIYKKVE